MNFEEIILKAQFKAQKIASKVEKALRKDSSLDPDELTSRFLSKSLKRDDKSEVVRQPNRLTYESIQSAYQKSGFKPSEGHYWFTDDYPKNPLIQISRLNLETLEGSPIAVLCLLYTREIAENTRTVTDTIKQNLRYFDLPSYKWTLGLISQLTELSCSYILGFNNGFDGNAELYPKCSSEAHLGYDDGFQLRQRYLAEGLLTLKADNFETETDSSKLRELYRVGYYEKSDE